MRLHRSIRTIALVLIVALLASFITWLIVRTDDSASAATCAGLETSTAFVEGRSVEVAVIDDTRLIVCGANGEPATEVDRPSTTSIPVTETLSPNPTTTLAPADGGPIYVNNFADQHDVDRLDLFVQYRDESVVGHTDGTSSHAPTEGVDCSGPFETRQQVREEPHGHIYPCHPGGDPEKGHLMFYAMNTTGYAFHGAVVDHVFNGVTEIRADINTTSFGNRNFVEMKVIPAEAVFTHGMPCVPDFPCNAEHDYDDLRAVGASTNNERGTGFHIATPDRPDGITHSRGDFVDLPNGDIEFQDCTPDEYCSSASVWNGHTDIKTRYTHILRDNGDGTISFGIEQDDGSFAWITDEGSFPVGPVRVVFAFHNYTGTKSGRGPGFHGNDDPSTGGVTWHADNFEVYADSAIRSLDYFGGYDEERIIVPPGCVAFSQGQRNNPSNVDIPPLINCPPGLGYEGTFVVGAIDEAVE